MQGVAELVEQGLGVVERKQRRFALARLGEVHDIDDQRVNVAPELFLVAQRRHPGAAVLRRAREIVAEEQSAMAPAGVAHFPHPHIGVPDRNAFAPLEAQSEQAVRGVERRRDDALELEIRLDRRFVDVAARLAQLLRVVAPVPRREREIAALRLHQRLHGIAIRQRVAARRQPDAIEQRAHGLRRLRHGIVEPVMGEARIAEEPRALGAQRHHLGDDRLVVGCAAAVAARDPGTKDLLAQVAPRRELQERLDARARQRDDVLAREAALLGRRARRRAHEIGQTGELVLAVEHEGIALLVRQHVLAEAGAERGEPLVDVGETGLRRGVERGAGALEHHVVAIEHALLLGREGEPIARAVQAVDAAEQGLVHQDAVPVLGLLRGELAFDLLDGVVGMRARQQVEHAAHAHERVAGSFQRCDGVGEGRLGRIGGDGLDLRRVRGRKRARTRAENVAARSARTAAPRTGRSSPRTMDCRSVLAGQERGSAHSCWSYGVGVVASHPKASTAAKARQDCFSFEFFRCETTPALARLSTTTTSRVQPSIERLALTIGCDQPALCVPKAPSRREEPWFRSS